MGNECVFRTKWMQTRRTNQPQFPHRLLLPTGPAGGFFAPLLIKVMGAAMTRFP